jgi:hypothetical protein
MTIRLGLDIDGVITAEPKRFADLSQRLIESAADVRIVTSRSAQAQQATEQELETYGVNYSELYFLPEISQAQRLCPHARLNWYEKYLWQKADYALTRNLSHFIDDDLVVERLFAMYAPSIAFVRYPDSLVWTELLQLVRASRGAGCQTRPVGGY